ncbi:hypothetical protein BDQ17DRAFT_1325030 [Cyathus striatus]|nr:hypothetical protein BDQ17DRAFT_1325030 [Cyathus striatus]
MPSRLVKEVLRFLRISPTFEVKLTLQQMEEFKKYVADGKIYLNVTYDLLHDPRVKFPREELRILKASYTARINDLCTIQKEFKKRELMFFGFSHEEVRDKVSTFYENCLELEGATRIASMSNIQSLETQKDEDMMVDEERKVNIGSDAPKIIINNHNLNGAFFDNPGSDIQINEATFNNGPFAGNPSDINMNEATFNNFQNNDQPPDMTQMTNEGGEPPLQQEPKTPAEKPDSGADIIPIYISFAEFLEPVPMDEGKACGGEA